MRCFPTLLPATATANTKPKLLDRSNEVASWALKSERAAGGGLNQRSFSRIKAHERDSHWRAQNSAMELALALRMDASWSLRHQLFYDTLSGGYNDGLER